MSRFSCIGCPGKLTGECDECDVTQDEREIEETGCSERTARRLTKIYRRIATATAAVALAVAAHGEMREVYVDLASVPSGAVDYVAWLVERGDANHAAMLSRWYCYPIAVGRFYVENAYETYIEVRDKDGYGLAGAWVTKGTDFTNLVFDAKMPLAVERRLKAWMPKAKRQGTAIIFE